MNKYLKKIAESTQTQENKKNARTGLAAGAGIAAGMVGGRYLSRIIRGVENAVVSKGKDVVSKKMAKSKIIIPDSYKSKR